MYLLDFSAGNAPFPYGPPPGTRFEGTIVLYPGPTPQRGLIKTRNPELQTFGSISFATTLSRAFELYSDALLGNPWILAYPFLLKGVIPDYNNGQLSLFDEERNSLPVSQPLTFSWPLLALSGGDPLIVFGEWVENSFLPRSVIWKDGFHNVTGNQEIAA